MNDHPWLDDIVGSSPFDELCQHVEANPRTVVDGSQGSSSSILAGALARRTGRPVLLVVAHPDDADEALDDLGLFDHPPGQAFARHRLPALEVLPGETGVSLELLGQRLHVVRQLLGPQGQAPGETGSAASVWVAPIQALMQAVPQSEVLDRLSLTVQTGQRLAPGGLFDWLTGAGYERVDAIEQPGQFAVRGGIVDIYLPAGVVGLDDRGSGGPIRLDYLGDQVESICRIDPDTMGSADPVQMVQVIGATADQLQCDDDTTSFLGLLPGDTVVVMHEMLDLAEQARGYYERLTNPRGIYPPQAVFTALTGKTHVQVNGYGVALSDQEAPKMGWPVRPLPAFNQNPILAVGELAGLACPGQSGGIDGAGSTSRVVVLCHNPAEKERLTELILDHAAAAQHDIRVEVGDLHRGFVWVGGRAGASDTGGGLFLVPHHELFHRYHLRGRMRKGLPALNAGAKVSDAFLDVAIDDYVVHADHGIALFRGMHTMRRGGRTQEYLTLEFANHAQLHVPTAQIELVQRYVGGFRGKPPLSPLGGKRWAKQKEHVAQAVKDLAAELLRVQAARSSMPGIRYPVDTTWQRRFEAEFPYEETQDQLAAAAQIKKDMHKNQPMDRLVCGDVGFGKTEVAVRAAFKAVEYGKQVAVLVPTTVLAEQHERTFRDRMADYPFRVESISRFKTPRQAAGVLQDLQRGEVDVIIGTHRLLSQDVTFADLGLVIIDEEQRFGVEHKHKLMRLRLTVDVLTLSATPIPRTLHMSMLGLRDISSLTTPPLDRRAIVTEVVAFDTRRIRHAIVRELNRQGQVYFVHNRVRNIQKVADQIHRLVPEACIAIGHGQMRGHELEEVMLRFMKRQIDVLVCTTIIESGIDIPTANTIFVNDADRFGLAELHQLRGRVGRYKHRAYCYLLLSQGRPITDTAARRLRAIEQYAMLGAGFKIAMRDLEIRGAGNLLGSQQSGHIAAVGYQMYCQLLERAARGLRNDPMIDTTKTHLELPVSGWLPKRYIGSDKFRMEAYRRLSRAQALDELEAVTQDLTNAYGDPPPPAQALLDLAQLRIAATLIGVEAIKLDGLDVIFRTARPQKLWPYLTGVPGRASVIDDRTVYWRPPPAYVEAPTLLVVLRKLLVGAPGLPEHSPSHVS